jgi:hypothetical protein
MTRNAGRPLTAGLLAAFVARAPKGRIELAADHSSMNSRARSRTARIEPIVEKLGSRFSFALRRMRLRDIAGHGVVSVPALQRRMIRG